MQLQFLLQWVIYFTMANSRLKEGLALQEAMLMGSDRILVRLLQG